MLSLRPGVDEKTRFRAKIVETFRKETCMLRRVKILPRRPLRQKLIGSLATVALVLALGGFAHAQDLERGEDLYSLCSQCHGTLGQGNELYLAPQISGLESWYVLSQLEAFRAGRRGLDFDDIAGMRMRPMALTLRSEEDVKSVAAYVASMPIDEPEPVLTGGNAEHGKALYVTCAACHGAAGEGIEGLKGPSLNHASDWYVLKQLQKFRSGIRGGDPAKDPTGAQMRAMALTLADDQAVLDVVAYIATLSK
jgi:cytochrome c oxidase subunit 2